YINLTDELERTKKLLEDTQIENNDLKDKIKRTNRLSESSQLENTKLTND
ncbi:16402_t:CDS:1, partial [Gigaspora margarita]